MLDIDTAIKHYLDIADGQDKCAEISVSEHAKERISQCAADHRQLAEWLKEFREAKRLLKAAVDDIHSRDYCNGCIYENAEGKDQYLNCEYHNCFKWRYADEALKLIEGGTRMDGDTNE